ncbi:MAG: cupin domain-containing protein, partial [Hyphomicrobiaceae bacterium]|nr:cupin domain-containing protein [Hyphomicrobiaceae bacterium]
MVKHPGFGVFNKAHREFFNALDDHDWHALSGYSGVEEKVLSGTFDHDARTGSVTRLSRWSAGAAVPTPVKHDWCEEVFIVSGTMSIGTPEKEEELLPAGTYAVRPPGISHGPFFSRDG